MTIRVINATNDAEEWRNCLKQLPTQLQDIYFWPEYSSLYKSNPFTFPLLFIFQKSDKIWAYPFMLQRIHSIGEHILDQEWFDIQTPYGYGGPISNTDDADFLANANAAFSDWCVARGIIAEFIRLHPFLENQRWLSPDVKVSFDRETTSIDLSRFTDSEPPSSKKVRNILRRAKSLGIRVKAYPAEDYIAKFEELYWRTMERLGADEYYYFSNEYFIGLGKLVGVSGWLLVSEQEGTWISAALFLKGSMWLHYHLSASDPKRRLPGTVNLLLNEAAKMGRDNGLVRMHLGGGRTTVSSDSLLKFKKAIATDMHSFYIGTRIHNLIVYDQLKEIWSQQYQSLIPIYGSRLLCYHCRPTI